MLEAIESESKTVFLAQEAIAKLTLDFVKQKKWFCPLCQDEVYIKEEYEKTLNEKIVITTSHFCHYSNKNCKGLGESDLHYQRKCFVASQLYTENILLKIEDLFFLLNTKNIHSIERRVTDNRADILIELKEFNPLIGRGIAIEIAVSESPDSLENKRENWSMKGYSIAILLSKTFENNKLIENTIEIDYPYLKSVEITMQNINTQIGNRVLALNNWKKELEQNIELQAKEVEERVCFIKKQIEYSEEKLIEKITKKIRTSCATCLFQSPDKRDTTWFCCWQKYKKKESKHPEKYPIGQIEINSCDSWVKK